jgi:hypothetical protein
MAWLIHDRSGGHAASQGFGAFRVMRDRLGDPFEKLRDLRFTERQFVELILHINNLIENGLRLQG